MKDYQLVPLNEVDEDARKLAVMWVEALIPHGTLDIEQKHKLSSDFMNYAHNLMDRWHECFKSFISSNHMTKDWYEHMDDWETEHGELKYFDVFDR